MGTGTGAVFKLGLEAVAQYSFLSTGIADAVGIDKGIFEIYRANGTLFSSTPMKYNVG
ncbi:Ig-like domain repeat protein, partial [Enterobacter hormaechei]